MIWISRALLALGVVSCLATAQDQPPVKIKRVPVSDTSAASGKEMFDSNCAVCDGLDGRGNGPAVAAMKVVPPDLTQLAAKNGGKFPTYPIQNSIHCDTNTPAAQVTVRTTRK